MNRIEYRLSSFDYKEIGVIALMDTPEGKTPFIGINCSDELFEGLLVLVKKDEKQKNDLAEFILALAAVIERANEEQVNKNINLN